MFIPDWLIWVLAHSRGISIVALIAVVLLAIALGYWFGGLDD